MKVKAQLGPEGRGIALSPDGVDLVGLSRLLRTATPPIQARRHEGRLLVSFDDGRRLAEVGLNLDYDPTLRRAVENRRRIDLAGDSVLLASREILAAGAAEARRLIQDSDLVERLDDHQAVNVAVMTVPGGWGTCLFDEQGTGKTVTVVTAFDVLVERGEVDVLIVAAPKSMIAEWKEEFRRFTGSRYKVAVADGTRFERASAIDSGANVIVVNYETIVSHFDFLRVLARRARAMLAIDESFFVKNPQASRTHAVRALREWCDRCFVLCGTPAPNSPHDLVAQFDLVDFGRTFRDARLDPDRDAAKKQVRVILDGRGFFLRSLKGDVLPDLPTRSFSDVRVRMAPQQQAAYDAALRDLILDLRATSDQEFSRNVSSYLERRAALLRICSDPGELIPGYDELPAKFVVLDAILAELIGERGEKVVVWSFYRAALRRIAARYSAYGIARIDGSVSDVAERRNAVRRFQEDDTTMVFVGNPAAAGAGLTLHRSNVAIYESLSNQAAHFLQSLDRIHRRGQERPVRYLTLLAENSIEEAEYRRLLDKADRQAELLGDDAQPRLTRSGLINALIAGQRSCRDSG